MRQIRWMYRWLRPAQGRLAGTLGLSAGTVLASTAMIATAGYLISASALRPPTILMLWVPIVAVRFFGTSRAALRYLDRLVSHDAILRLAARLRALVFAHLEANPGAWLGRRTGEMLDLVLADLDALQSLVLRLLLPLASACGASAFTAVWLWRVDPSVASIFGAGVLLSGAVLPGLFYGLTARWQKRRDALRRARTVALDDLVRGLDDVLAHGKAGRALEQIWDLEAKEDRLTARLDAAKAAAEGMGFAVAMATVGALLADAVKLHLQSHLSGTMIAAIALAAMASFEPWLALASTYAQAQEMAVSASRVADLTSQPAAMRRHTIPPQTAAPRGAISDDVVLSIEGLGCRRGSLWALQGIDLEVRRGQRVAIVGDSGAGKTTLFEAALGLIPIERGDIRWFGRPMDAWSDEELRCLVTAVPQDAYLFHTSLRQNLLLARPDATDEEMGQALAVAQLDDLVAHLPDGVSTVVGDRGFALSGGERQRVALARAVLRGAEVVLCDEPTASLDVHTEQAFLDAFFRATEGKTVVWITHRLVGLERMDDILVMQGGRVVERGTHAALLRQGGVYRQLWDLQRDRAFGARNDLTRSPSAPTPRPQPSGLAPT
ncbi:thiol reductant ABC exporter subunit CydC [Alicyclobacillus sendaiensis]|uniref:thiol reductant ABC exporter subunit CydC n=1 Tax=Alicyclobacillus sendaiensis TaxID=192387 RepID=UPI0026F42621|nr:thiol reductant ABC exporter subunit CydC [Alicyclobacillus sendaiensis]